MGIKHILTPLLLAATIVQGQDAVRPPLDTSDNEDTIISSAANETDTEDVIVQAPIYTDEECNGWLQTLVENDIDGSKGLSESEYHTFLSSIEDPPYIAEYFAEIPTFDALPWVFRVVHKSLACHCQKLGMGEECCEGEDAEVLLMGFDEALLSQNRNAAQEEYKDLFCQQIAYVLSKSIESPNPSKNPTVSPTRAPSDSPSETPTIAPVTASPVSDEPTFKPTPNGTVFVEEIRAAPQPEEEDGGLGIGAIIGIIIGALAFLALLIGFIIWKRRPEEEEAAPEGDLEEPDPADAPEDDDESSAPSVWSDSDKEDDSVMLSVAEVKEATPGSALAAMGAASNLVATVSSPTASEKSGGALGSLDKLATVDSGEIA